MPWPNPYLAFRPCCCRPVGAFAKRSTRARPSTRICFELTASSGRGFLTGRVSLKRPGGSFSADNAYLLDGGVFEASFLEHWIALKSERGPGAAPAGPTPTEFRLYYDALALQRLAF